MAIAYKWKYCFFFSRSSHFVAFIALRRCSSYSREAASFLTIYHSPLIFVRPSDSDADCDTRSVLDNFNQLHDRQCAEILRD